MSKLGTLNENTTVSIKIVIALIPVILWIASNSFETKANTKDIAEVKQDIHDIKEYLQNRRTAGDALFQRVASMEAKLDTLLRRH